MRNFFSFSRFTLLVALIISAIAAWYSVQGLMTIFAGATIPIMIMGGALELAKITTTVWLHKNWDRASLPVKSYLTIAVITLAAITSMGIFGLLSKAHSDQATVKGGNVIQIAEIDRQISIERRNIEDASKVIGQLDQAVQALIDANRIRGNNGSIAVRKSQTNERDSLNQIIKESNSKISLLEQQKLPLVQEKLNLEAEVGPIKYIAALIYGDNPDVAVLEKAVRWVIILLVVVFDPLAIILIIAANSSLLWERKPIESKETFIPVSSDDINQKTIHEELKLDPILEETVAETSSEVLTSLVEPTEPPIEEISTNKDNGINETENKVENNSVNIKKPDFSNSNYKQTYKVSISPIIIPEQKKKEEIKKEKKKNTPKEKIEKETVEPNVLQEQKIEHVEDISLTNPVIQTENVTTEAIMPENEYIMFEGKQTSLSALRGLRPDLVEKYYKKEILFGTNFPAVSRTGDIYTRVDIIPHKTYMFQKSKWIEIDKLNNTKYLSNIAYIQFLISKLDNGEYNPELLTVHEEEEIKKFLKGLSKLN